MKTMLMRRNKRAVRKVRIWCASQLLSCSFAAILVAPAVVANAQAGQPLKSQLSNDEAAVRVVVESEIQGWQNYDAKQVASLYTEDAIWQNPFGVRLHGRGALLTFLTGLMARPEYRAGKTTTPWKILDVRMVTAKTAAVWSDERIEGVIPDNSGVAIPLRHSYYLEVLRKEQGAWKITDFMVMDLLHPK